MKKTFIKNIIGVVVVASITMLTPLGVSAESKQCNNGTQTKQVVQGWQQISNIWYNFNSTGKLNTGWIQENGKWYYADAKGAMQTGIIKINGKVYCFNNLGAMQTGTIKIGSTTYAFNSNGQAIGTVPQITKEFDSNGNTVKPTVPQTNQNSTVTTTTSTKPNTTTPPKTTTSTNTTPPKTTNTTTTTSTSTKPNTTTVPTNTNQNSGGTTVDIAGLNKLPQQYPITIQNSAENKILELMNQKRTEAGLKPLTMDNTLLNVARYKSDHMIQYNYFDHTTPEGTNWTNWLKAIGYSYTTSGENIAYNTYDAVELFNQWWNSPGHRANMMNASYGKVGIGVLYGNGKYMGTQTFSN